MNSFIAAASPKGAGRCVLIPNRPQSGELIPESSWHKFANVVLYSARLVCHADALEQLVAPPRGNLAHLDKYSSIAWSVFVCKSNKAFLGIKRAFWESKRTVKPPVGINTPCN